jgi:hypothetical protein
MVTSSLLRTLRQADSGMPEALREFSGDFGKALRHSPEDMLAV